jgi:hypothetical protein
MKIYTCSWGKINMDLGHLGKIKKFVDLTTTVDFRTSIQSQVNASCGVSNVV